MKQIFNIDISERKTFKMFGELFILIARNIEHNTYLYEDGCGKTRYFSGGMKAALTKICF